MANIMQKYEIEVWFRFVIAGEQEKDNDWHTIEATDIQDAVNKANELYTSHKRIPFKFYHNGIPYIPHTLTKTNLFNLTNPSQCL